MMNVPENELFSAYLDGELTAAEQAEVERLLATSPAARQLLEELRALSSTLQSLPVHKLGEDLRQEVLRLAEQRVLSGRTDSDPFSFEPVAPTGRWRAIARRLGQPRIWVWPGLAVAVGLLLMVLQPEQAQRVAQQPAADHLAMAPKAAPRAPAEPLAVGALAEADREGRADERFRPAAMRATASSPPPASAPTTPAAKPDEARKVLADMPAAPAGPAAEMSAAARGRPIKRAEMGLPSEVRTAKEGPVELFQETPQVMLVVRCDVTPEGLRQGIVQQVLAKRQVVPVEQPSKQSGVRDYAAGRMSVKLKEKLDAKAAEEETRDAESVDKRAADSGRIVYLRAEATQAQLDAVLADLRSRPEVVWSFPSVSPVTSFGGGEQARRFSFGETAEPIERQQRSARSQQPVEARSTGGKRAAGQAQQVQGQPAMASAIDSASAANGRQDAQVQRRMSAKPGPGMAGLAPAAAPMREGQPLARDPAAAQRQRPVTYQVVFELHPVDPKQIAAEKAGKTQAGEPKASAAAKPAPPRAEAAKQP